MHRALLTEHGADIVGRRRTDQVWIGGNAPVHTVRITLHQRPTALPS
ncbi:hypothetical protein [Gordonia sp. NPDC003376]